MSSLGSDEGSIMPAGSGAVSYEYSTRSVSVFELKLETSASIPP